MQDVMQNLSCLIRDSSNRQERTDRIAVNSFTHDRRRNFISRAPSLTSSRLKSRFTAIRV